jgi:hypothetical protein
MRFFSKMLININQPAPAGSAAKIAAPAAGSRLLVEDHHDHQMKWQAVRWLISGAWLVERFRALFSVMSVFLSEQQVLSAHTTLIVTPAALNNSQVLE